MLCPKLKGWGRADYRVFLYLFFFGEFNWHCSTLKMGNTLCFVSWEVSDDGEVIRVTLPFPSVFSSIPKFLFLFQDYLPKYPFNHGKGPSKVIKKVWNREVLQSHQEDISVKMLFCRRGTEEQPFSSCVIGSSKCIYVFYLQHICVLKSENFFNALESHPLNTEYIWKYRYGG